MADDRLSVVLKAVAAGDGNVSIVDRVCLAAVGLLSLEGAGMSLMVNGELCGTAGVSAPGITTLQELQLSIGEGPCLDAWMRRTLVLEPDLSSVGAGSRWPAFARAGAAAGVRAVFAFPMTLGAIRVGVLVLYRDLPGGLATGEVAYGLVLADVATHVVLGLQAGAPADTLHTLLADEPPHWAEVHQATGMLSVRLGVTLDEGFVRLRARAFATGISLRDLARDVVAGRVRFVDSE